MTGTGPLVFDGNSTRLVKNPHRWSRAANVLYVDQPVGTGYSTASNPYPVRDNDAVTSDFYKWLKAFFSYFPHLQGKPLHMMGESYAGIYIPYIASAIVKNNDSFPIDLRSISLGDGTWGNNAAMTSVAIGAYLRSKQSQLKIPDDILAVFEEGDRECGFDEVIKKADVFPVPGKFTIPGDPEYLNYKQRLHYLQRRGLDDILDISCNIHPTTPEETRQSIMNSSCFGPCATFSTAMDYITTASEAGTGVPCFDMYDISNDCDTVDPLPLMNTYFSRADVQKALNIPPESDLEPLSYQPCNPSILETLLAAEPPTPPAYDIIPDLANFHGIHLHIYSGENDFLVNHFGTEVSMQNLTWRGTRGFANKPDKPFYINDTFPAELPDCTPTSDIKGLVCIPDDYPLPHQAGIWSEERRSSYHLFRDAGHSVFLKQPGPMLSFVRDVVVNQTIM